jgi:peptide deformylase
MESRHLSDIVLLGDPRLYQTCDPVLLCDLEEVAGMASSMKNVVLEFQQKYKVGRAIAAPQLGFMKRVVYMNKPREQVFVNPVLHDFSDELFEMWDDCMSFPHLLVKVRRHRTCKVTFRDLQWNEHTWEAVDDLSELLQHEYDHLNGILCIQRAVDNRSFRWKR